ncbi:protein disulfide-isomerase-like [Zingiber officinale]|uniref:Protein disulfide-isomerase n=1 Tax=Zingiber officinale TaxID=94328 RepID=A0A8J5G5B7_ZINOF|nr:protein disulfide-isomerase-like [Zingiber officinale]KAG6500670.1 hypothetical protein ZIOFF_040520 [Zingiber officinale]
MAISRVWISAALLALLVFSSAVAEEKAAPSAPEAEVEPSFVLTLEHANFSETIGKHPFIVVEFYAPWCGHCMKLAPEYEKAASILSKNDPPIVLAKVDANDDANKELASKYEIKGFPTLKIFRNGGDAIEEYKGPREADGIVEYLKKQAGPASSVIGSVEDAGNLIVDKKIYVVGIFQEFSGEKFENFIKVAEKLRSDYDFGHTLEAKFLPRGDPTVKLPVVRLFKPFDELFVDFEDFNVDALEKFIESASMPVVATFDKDPSNRPFLMKFFDSPNSKVLLFLNFTSENFDAFKSNLYEIAEKYKGNNLGFLIGDLEASQGAFQYFGLKEDQVPLIIIQENDGKKYLQPNLSPDHIATWMKGYMDGNLKPYRKSEPIPEVNTEPVKIVVADNLQEVVLNSGKNVLLEFYAPWCGHCKKLAPILDEVAISFENDADVVIAKMDATANDVPNEFNVKGYPTLYFSSASGQLSVFEGDRTAEGIINFLKANKDTTSHSGSTDSVKVESVSTDSVRDEL